ncbi:riboflavin biosynthesis protein [Gemmatimonadetes bacterium T265]|nr:riboflavin biosynthesis protein [Gemmatimonadetes bacterium T265]
MTDDRVTPPWGAVVTVGTFDGVHCGHADVLRVLAARARETALRSVLVTFAGHPLETLRPGDAPPLLTPGVEKPEALASVSVAIDRVVSLPFTPALAALSAEQFVLDVLRRQYNMRELLIGHDHGFGRGRAGDAAMLQALGAAHGFAVDVVPPVAAADGTPVSSTTVRDAVRRGDLASVGEQLGRPYGLRGHVVRGDQRGRLLGYPTLNIRSSDARKLLPPDGVYAVRVFLPDGQRDGMLNLGGRPTFGDVGRSIEVHLFDAAGDWYDAPVGVAFVARLRDVQRFDGVDALVAQLDRDAQAARLAVRDA